MSPVHIQNREGQVKMKVAAQFFFAYHCFSKSCLLPTPTAQVIAGVQPSRCYVLVSSPTSSQTLIQRGLGSVIWIEINVTLLVDAGLVLFPLLSSFPRSPLFSLLPRFYYQTSSYAPPPQGSLLGILRPWNPRALHYLNCSSSYHSRRDPISHLLRASWPVLLVENTDRILKVPWPTDVFKLLKPKS